MVSAVVFDLDYTLAVPDRSRETLLAAASDAVGAPSVSRNAYVEAHRETDHGTTRAPIFERLFSERRSPADGDTADAESVEIASADGDLADVDPADVATAYREAVAEATTPIDGAEALVRTLAEEYAVGLLTDGPTRAGRSKLRALGWSDLFDAAVVTGEVSDGKPDPRGFEVVCERLGVTPDQAVYVGDDPDLDVAGATAAGMAVVQVLYEGGPDRDARATAAVRRDALTTVLPDLIAELE